MAFIRLWSLPQRAYGAIKRVPQDQCIKKGAAETGPLKATEAGPLKAAEEGALKKER